MGTCPQHCPPGGGAMAAVVTVAAVAVAAVPVVAVLSAAVAVVPAVTITILALCVAGVVVVRHLVLYGRQRKPRPIRQRVVRPALARGPLALENKTITITPDMFVAGAVKEEVR